MRLTSTTESSTVVFASTTVVKEEPNWEAVAHLRRQEINGAIPPEYIVEARYLKSAHLVNLWETCGLLTARELTITSLSATVLLKQIHNKTYSAVEVTRAFCKTAAIAHQAVRIRCGRRGYSMATC
jgi:hypothetical protein